MIFLLNAKLYNSTDQSVSYSPSYTYDTAYPNDYIARSDFPVPGNHLDLSKLTVNIEEISLRHDDISLGSDDPVTYQEYYIITSSDLMKETTTTKIDNSSGFTIHLTNNNPNNILVKSIYDGVHYRLWVPGSYPKISISSELMKSFDDLAKYRKNLNIKWNIDEESQEVVADIEIKLNHLAGLGHYHKADKNLLIGFGLDCPDLDFFKALDKAIGKFSLDNIFVSNAIANGLYEDGKKIKLLSPEDTTKPSLADLPNEILLHIGSFIGPRDTNLIKSEKLPQDHSLESITADLDQISITGDGIFNIDSTLN